MTNKKLKICAVTTTRADYGIMRPLLLKLHKEKWCDLRICVSGTHLLEEYGYTINEILEDNLNISFKLKLTPYQDDQVMKTAEIMANTIEYFTEYFIDEKPDAVLGKESQNLPRPER